MTGTVRGEAIDVEDAISVALRCQRGDRHGPLRLRAAATGCEGYVRCGQRRLGQDPAQGPADLDRSRQHRGSPRRAGDGLIHDGQGSGLRRRRRRDHRRPARAIDEDRDPLATGEDLVPRTLGAGATETRQKGAAMKREGPADENPFEIAAARRRCRGGGVTRRSPMGSCVTAARWTGPGR